MKSLLLGIVLLLSVNVAWSESSPALISVTGVAEKSVEPNLLSMTVEVWSKALNAKAAQGLAAQELKKVKNVFEMYKVKKEDIQTLNYSLNPEYVYEPKSQQNKIVGYRAVQMLRVTLRKVEDGGAFIDSLSSDSKGNSSGVNLNSILWETDKQDALQAAGLQEAVKMARQKAEEIAKAAGVKIKAVYRIVHGAPAPAEPRMGFAKAMMAEAAPTEISAGQVKVRVEVQADYEIQ